MSKPTTTLEITTSPKSESRTILIILLISFTAGISTGAAIMVWLG